MRLFHYHHWTPFLEEMETFYTENGFKLVQRMGNDKGKFKTLNPPLTWKDFRKKEITFRIIEVRKGHVNVTFGTGNKNKFDHIGFFTSKEEHDTIGERAIKLGWKTEIGEKRTFIYHEHIPFKIEIQYRKEYIMKEENNFYIKQMVIYVQSFDFVQDLSNILNGKLNGNKLGNINWNIAFLKGFSHSLHKVVFQSVNKFELTDPIHVRLIGN